MWACGDVLLVLDDPRRRVSIEIDAFKQRKGATMNPSHDHPLADFTRNAPELLSELKRTGEPVLLTVDGKPEFVIQDAASYKKLVAIADQAEVVAAVRQGLEEIKAGLGRPADEVFDEIRREFSIPRET